MIVSQDRLNLPWTNEGKENQRFSLILISLVIVLLVLSIWIPSVVLPEKDRKTLEKLPPQLAKLVKKKAPPKVEKKKPLPKVKEKKKVIEKEKKIEKPKIKKEVKPKEKKILPKLKKPKVVKEKNLTKQVKKARAVAKNSGLLALQNDLSDLKSIVNVSALQKKIAPKRAQTIAARASSSNAADVLKKSGGIKTDTLSVPAESIQLASMENVVLDATNDEISLAKAEAEAATRINNRSSDSIRLVAESLKAAFSKLYNRELRNDPFLEGLVMLEVVIEPTGEVSFCRVVSSELNNEKLEKKIVSRMYLADFGAEDVLKTTVNLPFPFRPN